MIYNFAKEPFKVFVLSMELKGPSRLKARALKGLKIL